MGLLLFALVYLLTRKRVKVFLDRYLIRYFVLCKLISDILRNYFLVPPYCIHIVAFAPKLPIPYLYFRFACRSNIISELFPLRYPINCDTLYLGGILTSIWIWSGHVSASIISTPLYSHSFLRMLPISVRICPYIASLRYFGAKTMCYLQFQRVCARLSISSFFCVPNMDISPLLLFVRSANLLRL